MIRNDAAASPVVGILLMLGIVMGIAGCIYLFVDEFGIVKPQYESTPTDSFQQGIEDGMNETYAPDLHRAYLSTYRDGYKTGLTIKYCNCTGGTP